MRISAWMLRISVYNMCVCVIEREFKAICRISSTFFSNSAIFSSFFFFYFFEMPSTFINSCHNRAYGIVSYAWVIAQVLVHIEVLEWNACVKWPAAKDFINNIVEIVISN